MRAGVGILATALLGFGIAVDAWPWVVDDAFISMRYAVRLAAGDGLTWTDGERVEGYSNLLWVLLTALGARLGCDPITTVRVLGVACTVLTFAVLLGSDLLPRSAPARLAVATTAALATTSTWAIAGLEAPLAMLLLALAMAGLRAGLSGPPERAPRGLLLAGVALALGCWTRPDGPLWTAVAGATAWFASAPTGRWRRLAWLAAPSLAAVLLQLGFRLAYYGDWLPNTGRAKVTGSAEARRAGLDYAISAAAAMRALLVPAVLGALTTWARPARPILVFATAATALWWLYVLQMGGDAFPRSRLLVPSLAPLTVLAAHGFDHVASGTRAARAVATALALGSIVLARVDAAVAGDDPRQRLPAWEQRGLAAGAWLGRAFAEERPLLAVDAAGAVPFRSGLPCLDMLGLCDRTIATTPVHADGFVAGHNRGNGAYVLSRRPDLVMFGLPPGGAQPQWPGGWQMERDPGFLRDYRVLVCETDGPEPLRLTLWARLDGRVGARREGGRVTVPGYWLGSHRQPYAFSVPPADAAEAERRAADMQSGIAWWTEPGVVAALRADGAVVGRVRRPGRHVLSRLPLEPGRYAVRGEDLPAGVTASLEGTPGASVTSSGAVFTVAERGDGPVTVDVVCTVAADAEVPCDVEALVLEPVP